MKSTKVIGIDLSMVDESKAGIGYYAYSLAQSLITNYPQNDYFLYTNEAKKLNDFEFPNTKIIQFKGKINIIWHLRVLRDISKRNLNFFVSPSNFFYGIYYKKTIQIVHDLAPLKYPDSFKKQSVRAYKRQIKRLFNSKNLIATNSQTTLQDITKLDSNMSSKVHYIGTGLSSWLNPHKSDPSQSVLKSRFALKDKYILSIGTIQPRKNYKNAIEAFYEFQKIHKDYSYVVVGKAGWLYKDIIQLVKKLDLEDKVKFIGYQSEDVIRTLLSNASIFLQSSTWEGFGMPLLEAYYFSLPIAASDIEVFREVIGNNATFFDPKSPYSIFSALQKVSKLGQTKLDQEFLKEYDWAKVADRLIKVAVTIDKA